MMKHTRLLAPVLLALASVFAVPERANAMPIICHAAELFLSDINNAPYSGYSYWVAFWYDHCAE